MRAEPGLVSVVMAARNAERFIPDAIESVLAQTHEPTELIVVDDGSVDRTAEIAAGYGVRVLRRPTGGPSAARNAGLAAAQGEFWTYLDSDDVMPPDRLALQVEALGERPNVGIALGLADVFTTPGDEVPLAFARLAAAGTVPGLPGTMLVRRDVLRTVGTFDETLTLGEDHDWLTRARDAGVGIAHLDVTCLRYRIHAGNTSLDVAGNRAALLGVIRRSLARRRATGTGPPSD